MIRLNADVHILLGKFHHYFSHLALDMTLICYSNHSQREPWHVTVPLDLIYVFAMSDKSEVCYHI